MSWQESSASNPDHDSHVMKQFHTRVMPLKPEHDEDDAEEHKAESTSTRGADHSELLEFEGTERLILLTRKGHAPAC